MQQRTIQEAVVLLHEEVLRGLPVRGLESTWGIFSIKVAVSEGESIKWMSKPLSPKWAITLLTLEKWRSRIYRLRGRKGTLALAEHTRTGGGPNDPEGEPDDPGFRDPDDPGDGPDGPDVPRRQAAARMSGVRSRHPTRSG